MSDEQVTQTQETPAGETAEHSVVETASVVTDQTTETPTTDQADDVHPLEPEGDRFKQVWARAKRAEAEKERLRDELQREREERIRQEERLKAKEETQAAQSTQKEYTWEQLEAAIEEGKITRAWANTYREELVAKKAKDAAKRELQEEQQRLTQKTSVESELDRYKQLVPDVMQRESPIRQKVEREYAYMVQTLGFKEGLPTQLAAVRAALGDLDTVERSVKAKHSTTREPFMETHSSTQKPQQKSSKFIDKLDERLKAHYEKMIRTGQYAGWDEIEAELKYVPPTIGARRG